MAGDALTHDRAHELLHFLPEFERPGRRFIKDWCVGASTLPYPVYEEDVVAFFHLAGQAWWSASTYDPATASKMLDDDQFIRGCTLDDVRTMLTFCVRMEMFSDGLWGHVLETGRVTALLRRLAVLRAALPEGRAAMDEGH